MLATAEQTAKSQRQQDLFASRTNVSYTQAERRYSAAIQSSINDLLEGRLNRLLLLRRYHDDPDRVAVEGPERSLTYAELRSEAVARREALERHGVSAGDRVITYTW